MIGELGAVAQQLVGRLPTARSPRAQPSPMGTESRVSMHAVIAAASRSSGLGGGPDDGEVTFFDAVTDHLVGGDDWNLVLDVTGPDGEGFRHAGRFRVANRLGGLRRAMKRWQPVPGLVVPVLVSADRSTVEIDWTSFAKGGGIEQAVRLGTAVAAERGAVQGAAATGAMLAKQPRKAAKQRELALQHAPEMAVQVTTGVRPAREFGAYVSGLVQGGALSGQEGDDLLRLAGLLPPDPGAR